MGGYAKEGLRDGGLPGQPLFLLGRVQTVSTAKANETCT